MSLNMCKLLFGFLLHTIQIFRQMWPRGKKIVGIVKKCKPSFISTISITFYTTDIHFQVEALRFLFLVWWLTCWVCWYVREFATSESAVVATRWI